MVAVAELRGPTAAAGTYPCMVNVLRREPDGPARSAIGLSPTWTTIAGLSGLVGHYRFNGKWVDKLTGEQVDLRDNQAIIMVADLPAGGSAGANQLLVTDRLQVVDDIYGTVVFQPMEVRDRAADGLCWALCEWAREEGVA
jgi:hypothetical protein